MTDKREYRRFIDKSMEKTKKSAHHSGNQYYEDVVVSIDVKDQRPKRTVVPI